jgi:hypothetical protein
MAPAEGALHLMDTSFSRMQSTSKSLEALYSLNLGESSVKRAGDAPIGAVNYRMKLVIVIPALVVILILGAVVWLASIKGT